MKKSNLADMNTFSNQSSVPQTLILRNLTIAHGEQILLKNVGFEIIAGRITALIGASGSGKSLSALALQGILPSNLTRLSGEITLNGKILEKSEIHANRGKIVATILQNPRTCFNPLLSMKSHICESLSALNKPFLQDEVEAILREVGLQSSVLHNYAFELSGGMLQRVMIAIALLSGARFLIADEATTDLDMVVEDKILRLLRDLQTSKGLGILLISHDRRVVELMADKIYEIRKDDNAPLHNGICHIEGNARSISNIEPNRDISVSSKPQYGKSPKNIDSHADVQSARNEWEHPTSIAEAVRRRIEAPQNAIIAHNVSKIYTRYTLFGTKQKRVLNKVSLRVGAGERVALLGASGSGKSTLARMLCALESLESSIKPSADWATGDYPTNAGIYLNGERVESKALANPSTQKEFYKQVQILFQDPLSSLNPRLTLWESLCEPLQNLLGVYDAREQEVRILSLLARLRLESSLLDYYPAMLSGGQASRFCLARALLVCPKYILLDEVTSGLDFTLECEILGILREMQAEMDLGILLITHSVELARRWCERIYIMQNGEIVEEARANEAFKSDFGAELDRIMDFGATHA